MCVCVCVCVCVCALPAGRLDRLLTGLMETGTPEDEREHEDSEGNTQPALADILLKPDGEVTMILF